MTNVGGDERGPITSIIKFVSFFDICLRNITRYENGDPKLMSGVIFHCLLFVHRENVCMYYAYVVCVCEREEERERASIYVYMNDIHISFLYTYL